jgi:hypothetical protein
VFRKESILLFKDKARSFEALNVTKILGTIPIDYVKNIFLFDYSKPLQIMPDIKFFGNGNNFIEPA